MRNCGKHFPGHGVRQCGFACRDPVDQRSLKAILADDARPYDWHRRHARAAVMPAHVIYREGRCAAGGLLVEVASGRAARRNSASMA